MSLRGSFLIGSFFKFIGEEDGVIREIGNLTPVLLGMSRVNKIPRTRVLPTRTGHVASRQLWLVLKNLGDLGDLELCDS